MRKKYKKQEKYDMREKQSVKTFIKEIREEYINKYYIYIYIYIHISWATHLYEHWLWATYLYEHW
jgi:hypothetical protein